MWKRRIKIGPDSNFPLKTAGPALLWAEWNQFRDRLVIFRDHDLLTPGHPGQKPGELGFGLMDIDYLHNLAKLSLSSGQRQVVAQACLVLAFYSCLRAGRFLRYSSVESGGLR